MQLQWMGTETFKPPYKIKKDTKHTSLLFSTERKKLLHSEGLQILF